MHNSIMPNILYCLPVNRLPALSNYALVEKINCKIWQKYLRNKTKSVDYKIMNSDAHRCLYKLTTAVLKAEDKYQGAFLVLQNFGLRQKVFNAGVRYKNRNMFKGIVLWNYLNFHQWPFNVFGDEDGCSSLVAPPSSNYFRGKCKMKKGKHKA